MRMTRRGIGLGVGAMGIRIADSWLGHYLWRRLIPARVGYPWSQGVSFALTVLAGSYLMGYVPVPRILRDNWEDAGAFLAFDTMIAAMSAPLSRVFGPGLSAWEDEYGIVGSGNAPSYPYGMLGDWETEYDGGMGDYVTVPTAEYAYAG